ncbi:MAG: hypothetical protein K8R21_01390 [Leptospira sp.]|nr:hypothetical protein [Leptospira sp.]
MSDRYSFKFEPWVWKNLRHTIRDKGIDSFYYKALNSLLSILNNKAGKASWLYRQIWLETSDSQGLIDWGVELDTKKIPGEPEETYKDRLLIIQISRRTVPTVAAKKKAISISTDISIPEIKYYSVYNLAESRSDHFKMGGPLDSPMMPRKYIIYRYRFIIPYLGDSFDRNQLIKTLERMNIGGNIFEVWEDKGEFQPFIMGGTLTGTFHSRRANKKREFYVY